MTHPSSAERTTRRLLAALAVFVSVISVYMMRIADPDLWGHLRYGRLFIEQRSLSLPDPFAYTTAGLTWHTHEYLSQILLRLTYDLAGPPGLIALKCLVGGAALYVLYRCIRLVTDAPRIWAPILMLAAILLGRFYLFRPQIFTYLLLAIFTLTLIRYLFDLRARLWILPLLLIPWANLHGGFVAGIGVIGLALGLRVIGSWRRHSSHISSIWRDTRALLGTLLACLGASLLTPMGWQLWPFLVTELGNPYNRRYLVEWQPVRLSAPGLDGLLLLFLVALLLIAGFLAQRRVPQIAGLRPWHWLVSCLPLAIMALQSHRHIPIMLIWAVPILALLGGAAIDAWSEARFTQSILALLTALILVPALLGAYYTLSDPSPRIRLTKDSLGNDRPFGAVAFMRANELGGNVYAPLWWGAYLTWELYPDILVSMDGRNDTLFPVEMVGENLIFYKGRPDTPHAPLRYTTDFLLVPAGSEVLSMARADEHWTAIFDDSESILFVRNDEDHAGLLSRYRAGELHSPSVSVPQFFY